MIIMKLESPLTSTSTWLDIKPSPPPSDNLIFVHGNPQRTLTRLKQKKKKFKNVLCLLWFSYKNIELCSYTHYKIVLCAWKIYLGLWLWSVPFYELQCNNLMLTMLFAAEGSTIILAWAFCDSCPDLFAKLCIVNEDLDLWMNFFGWMFSFMSCYL